MQNLLINVEHTGVYSCKVCVQNTFFRQIFAFVKTDPSWHVEPAITGYAVTGCVSNYHLAH